MSDTDSNADSISDSSNAHVDGGDGGEAFTSSAVRGLCNQLRANEPRVLDEYNISYESLGLTTTETLPMRDVLSAMEDDAVWDCQFYRPNLTFRLLVFLYGKGYYANLPLQERIDKIEQCLTRAGGNQKRLSEIAFSDQSDRILANEEGFDCYFCMASTARMLFDRATSKGGFPVEAYYRKQASSICYIVAVCMWLTLKLQRDYPNRKQLPIDVGYMGRRYVIDTLEGLELRVIEDKGDNALDLLKKIIGDINKDLQKVNCDFRNFLNDKNHQERQRALLEALGDKEAHLGLVTQFSVCKNFQKSKPEHQPETFGYWRFDGDSIDCEGEFVTMEKDGNVSTEHDRLLKMWKEQLSKMEGGEKGFRAKMKEVIDMSPRKDNNREDDVAVERNNVSGASVAESESSSDSEGKHAMVMLGACTELVANTDKRFYVLWNWWETMPLVLVSFEYLVACRCEVFFLSCKLPADICEKAQCSEALACECAFPDHGENTHFAEE
jgi:hypothetical protein